MMARRYRPRKRFVFWLYHDLAEDTRLMEYIDYLLKTNQFTKSIRNGLRLMWTLGEGDLSVLFELFPTLRAKLAPSSDELIEQFRQMLQAQPLAVAAPLTPALPSMTGKQLAVPQIAMPSFDQDDDQDTIVIRRDESADASAGMNFLDAALGLQGSKPAP